MQLGIHAAHEIVAPDILLTRMQSAERSGFQAASCSDHFHPWTTGQGQSGFAWVWLGSALASTRMKWGVVTAPGQRYHPAILAQAAATIEVMYPGRFWLALGTGEALNESITGEKWPPKPERRLRLLECVDVIRSLWRGETVSAAGHIAVENATLFTLPEKPPPIYGAALTVETAHWVGGWADGLITAGSELNSLAENIRAFREGGAANKPIILQSMLCFAESAASALQQARIRWPVACLETKQLADVATPQEFDRLTQSIQPRDMQGKLRIATSVQEIVDWLLAVQELGIAETYLHHIGDEQAPFLEVCRQSILPLFGK